MENKMSSGTNLNDSSWDFKDPNGDWHVVQVKSLVEWNFPSPRPKPKVLDWTDANLTKSFNNAGLYKASVKIRDEIIEEYHGSPGPSSAGFIHPDYDWDRLNGELRRKLRDRADDAIGQMIGELHEPAQLVLKVARGLIDTVHSLRNKQIPKWALINVHDTKRVKLYRSTWGPKTLKYYKRSKHVYDSYADAKAAGAHGIKRIRVADRDIVSSGEKARFYKFQGSLLEEKSKTKIVRLDRRVIGYVEKYKTPRIIGPLFDHVSSSYIAGIFAVKPMMDTLYTLCNVYKHGLERDIAISVKAGDFSSSVKSEEYQTGGAWTRVRWKLSGTEERFHKITALGTLKVGAGPFNMENVGVWIWNFIPFSFVVDWFLDVGGWLESFSALDSYSSVSLLECTTHKQSWTVEPVIETGDSILPLEPAAHTRLTYTRETGRQLGHVIAPSLHAPRKPWQTLVTATALFQQARSRRLVFERGGYYARDLSNSNLN